MRSRDFAKVWMPWAFMFVLLIMLIGTAAYFHDRFEKADARADRSESAAAEDRETLKKVVARNAFLTGCLAKVGKRDSERTEAVAAANKAWTEAITRLAMIALKPGYAPTNFDVLEAQMEFRAANKELEQAREDYPTVKYETYCGGV